MHEQQEEQQISETETMSQCPSCGLQVSAKVDICPQDGTRLNDPFADSALEHKYKFLDTIASGGMGIVYKARQLGLDKIVAIKMIHSHLLGVNVMQRFQREARAMALLSHPNVVAVIDFGVTKSGHPFIVMDYLEGVTITDLLEKEGVLETDRLIKLFLQTCNGLAHAHLNGVLHRDIKPSNIMICKTSEGETVKVLDFGIAKLTDAEKAAAMTLTKTGETVGSPQYMSPEQSKGVEADQRSDLYSLGCVMHEALVGVPPFVGKTLLETMLMHINDKPRSLFEISGKRFDPKIEQMIAKLLAKAPADRYQTVAELKNDLLAISPTGKPGFGAFIVPKSLRKAPQLSRRTITVAGVIALSLGTAALVKVLYDRSQSPASIAIAAALNKDPVHLDLSQAQLHLRLTDDQLAKLKDDKTIQTVDLSDSAITDSAFKYLAFLHLSELKLAGTKVVSLNGIESVGELHTLDLSRTPIDDKALPNIEELNKLQRLILKGDKSLPPNTLDHFDRLEMLRNLNVEGCFNLTTESINAFQAQHRNCKVQFTDPHELRALASERAAAHDWKSACSLLDDAERVALTSKDLALYVSCAMDKCQILRRNYQWPRTVDACESAINTIKANGSDASLGQLYALQGLSLDYMGLHDRAAPCYAKALNYFETKNELGTEMLPALFQAAHDANAVNDGATIARCAALSANPKLPQAPDLGFAYNEIGIWFVNQGDRRGIDYLLKAKVVFDKSPEYVTPLNFAITDLWLGRAYKNLGAYQKANSYLKHAVELSANPTIQQQAYTDLLEIARKLSHTKEAAIYAEKLKAGPAPAKAG